MLRIVQPKKQFVFFASIHAYLTLTCRSVTSSPVLPATPDRTSSRIFGITDSPSPSSYFLYEGICNNALSDRIASLLLVWPELLHFFSACFLCRFRYIPLHQYIYLVHRPVNPFIICLPILFFTYPQVYLEFQSYRLQHYLDPWSLNLDLSWNNGPVGDGYIWNSDHCRPPKYHFSFTFSSLFMALSIHSY